MLRSPALLLALVLAGVGPLATARPATAAIDVLAANAADRWIPFELAPINQIRLTVMIDGRPVAAILDTGASYSVVSRAFAARRRLTLRPGPRTAAIGGHVVANWTDLGSLELGGLARRNARVAVVDLPAQATGGGADLLIGRDLIQDYALELDFDASRMRLLPSGQMPFRGDVSPLAIGGDWPVYITQVAVGVRGIERIVIDSGDGGDVTLTNGAWSSLLPPPALSSTLTYGVGGAAVTGIATLPSVSIGRSTAQHVTLVVEPPGGFTQTIGMMGRIGAGFLRRFHVLLDPRAGRMVLAPGRAAVTPLPRSTSGLLLRRDANRLTVVHVMRNSPAADGEWRVGEQICQVDGTTVAAAGDSLWQVGEPGRTVRLTLCDGKARDLTLRIFY